MVLAVLTPGWAFGTPAFDVWPEATTHLLFLAYLAIALAGVAHASLRWARACSGVVRLGLRLVAAGSILGIVYATGKVVATVLELAGARPTPLITTSQLAALAGLVLVAAGSALPGIDRLWRATRHGVIVRRRLDALYPLWSDLVDVTPGIALEPVTPRWRDRLHVRDLDMRLYRRVIEIQDGQLALSRPDVVKPQAGRAADLRTALALPSEQRARPMTVDDEVTWWSEVALSYDQLRQADARASRR